MIKKIYILTFASLAFLLLTGISGYSVNPVDPPKPVSNAATVTLPSTPPTDECSDLMSEVEVTVVVTVTDCPDYVCQFPDTCTVKICLIELPSTPLGCTNWDPDRCTYTFYDIRANEGYNICAYFEVTPTGCLTGYNHQSACVQVPIGGGQMNINTEWCD